MHNKRQISCRNSRKISTENDMPVVCRKHLHWKNDIKNCLVNVWIVQCNNFSFSHDEAAIFPIPCSANHNQTQNILRSQMPQNDRKCTLFYAKYGVCLNSLNHRKPAHLNITIEGSDLMTSIAVLLSFHKQHVYLIVSF
jgi:hypothetical protein